MSQWMDTCCIFCYDTRRKKQDKETQVKEPQRSTSPISRSAESPPQKESNSCANMCCVYTTENLSEWKHIRIQKQNYWLCSQDCFDEWINSTEYTPWSPLRHFVPVGEPPPLVLE